MRRDGWLALLVAGSVAASIVMLDAGAALAQTPAQFFEQSCAACHTIGGGQLVGPDLKGVTDRKDRQWLTRFIEDPQAVIDSGDAYARQLVAAAQGMVMPKMPGLTHEGVEALLDFIDAQSKQPRPGASGPQVTDRPFTPADIGRGRDAFTGAIALSAGGPSCFACHQVDGFGGLGGGALGPDLTQVYTRLQGRKGLGGWLSAPATPTMQKLFSTHKLTADETESLLAFFEDAANRQTTARTSKAIVFASSGIGGAALGLVLFAWAWRGRFRAVRRRLVEAVRSGGTR